MNRDDVELLLRRTRPVAAPPLRISRTNSRLPAAFAAAFLLSLVAVMVLPPRIAERPVPGERRWTLPREIAPMSEIAGEAVLGVSELARTPRGGVAVITDWNAWISPDGRAPWKHVELPGWHPATPFVDGDLVSLVTAASWEYVTLDVAKGEIATRVRLPNCPAGKKWSTYLAGRGRDRYVVLGILSGSLFFLRSSDGGATWSKPMNLAQFQNPNIMVQHNAALVASPAALWLFHLSEDRRILVRRSVDGGATWSEEPGPTFLPEWGKPDVLRAATIGEDVHLLCLPENGRRPIHFVTSNGGKTWSIPGPVPPLGEEVRASQLKIRSGGGRLVVSAGSSLVVSEDRGRTWTDLDAFKGLRGTVQACALSAGPDGSVDIAPMVVVDGRRSLLLREWKELPPPSPLDDAGRRALESALARLGGDDPRVRDRAVEELVALGEPAAAMLRRELALSKDLERRGRLQDAIRRIEQRWPDGQVPDWWRGAADR